VSDDFTGELGIEAIRIAQSRGATAIDVEDVREADRKLRDSRNAERKAWILGLGGIFGGAAAAAIVALVISPTPARASDLWWLVIAVLGSIAMISFGASYPRKKRRALLK
jgi:hypothetical protein